MSESIWDEEQTEADMWWFARHRGTWERVRPATVAEQVWMFETSGGEVHDDIRITFEVIFDRGVWGKYEKFPA